MGFEPITSASTHTCENWKSNLGSSHHMDIFDIRKKKKKTKAVTYTHSEPIYKLTDKIFTNFRSLNEQLIKEIEKKHTALASLYSETAL